MGAIGSAYSYACLGQRCLGSAIYYAPHGRFFPDAMYIYLGVENKNSLHPHNTERMQQR